VKEKIVFGTWEGISIIITLICTQIFLNLPRLAAEDAGTAGWMLIAYAAAVTFILLLIIVRLYKKYEGMDIIEISETLMGVPGRIITGLILVAHIFIINSITLREFSENMKIISLQLSPISFVSLFFIAAMILGAYAGIEGQARIAAIIVPVVTAGYFVIILGVLRFIDVSRIMPVFGLGPNKIFIEGLSSVSIFSALIVLLIIAPFLKTYKTFKSVAYSSFWISAVLLTLSTLIYLLVYPYPNATENFLPMYQLARIINFGRFFQRIESIFLFIWAIAAMLFMSIALFLTVYIFAKTFKLRYYRPLLLPFAVIVFTASLIPENLVTAIEVESVYFRNYSWILAFAVPMLLLIIGAFTKKNPKKGRGKSEND
jgi:spore germination protein (amino acid permease)